MKFFDRIFGRNSDDEQPREEKIPEGAHQNAPRQNPEPPVVAEPLRYQAEEHIAKALSVLLSLHKEKKTDETLVNILRCLMENPPLFVPMKDGAPELTVSDAGEHLLPVFTSMDQVADSYREGRKWTQLRFLELKSHVSGITGILFNGFSHEFVLHRMTFPMFFDIVREQPAGGNADVVPHNLQENKTFLLTPAGKEADALKEAAIKFLATHDCRKAFFGKLNNNGEESYLFAIEQNACPDSEYFKLMHKELAEISTSLPIDYTSYEGFRKHITSDNCQMIFHQGQ